MLSRRSLIGGLLSLPLLSWLKPAFGQATKKKQGFVHPFYGELQSVKIKGEGAVDWNEAGGGVRFSGRYITFPEELSVCLVYADKDGSTVWEVVYACFNAPDKAIRNILDNPRDFCENAALEIDNSVEISENYSHAKSVWYMGTKFSLQSFTVV